jgi:hypothetical protein
MTGYNRIFHGLADVVEQDGPDFVLDETARLAEECARQLSMRNPTNKGQLNRDIRSVFAPLPLSRAMPNIRLFPVMLATKTPSKLR